MNIQRLINDIPYINNVSIEKCKLRIRELSVAIPKKQVLICAGLTSLLYFYNPSIGSFVIKGGMWLAGLGITVKISAPQLCKIPKVNHLANQIHFRINQHVLASILISQIKKIAKESFRLAFFNLQLMGAKNGFNMLERLSDSNRDLLTYPERYQIYSEICKHNPHLMTKNSFVGKLLVGEQMNIFTSLTSSYGANKINNLSTDTVQDILNLKFQGLLHIDNMRQHNSHLIDTINEYIEYMRRVTGGQDLQDWSPPLNVAQTNVAHAMVQNPKSTMSNANTLSLGINIFGTIDAIDSTHRSRQAAIGYRCAERVEFQANAFKVLYQVLLRPDKRKEDLWRWCGYCAILCYFYKVPHDLIEKSLPILKALTEIVDPGLRNILTSILFDHFYPNQNNSMDQFMKLHGNEGVHPLIAMFLAIFNFPIANLSNEEIAILKFPIDQENAVHESILNSLWTLWKDKNLAIYQKNIILRSAFSAGTCYLQESSKALQELKKHLFLVEAGLRSGEAKVIAKVMTTATLERHFIEDVGLTRIENYFEKLFATFGLSEDPVRILMYIRNLKNKNSLSNPRTLAALQKYIIAVLEKKLPVRKMAHLDVILQLHEREKAFAIRVKGSNPEIPYTFEDIDADFDRFLTTKYRRFCKDLDYDPSKLIPGGNANPSIAAELNYEPKKFMENLAAHEVALSLNPDLPENLREKTRQQIKEQGLKHPTFISIYRHLLTPKYNKEILWKWLGYCALACQAYHVPSLRIKCSEPILKAITELRPPLLDTVSRILIEHFYLPLGNKIESFEHFSVTCSLQPIIALLLTSLGFTTNNPPAKEMIELLSSKSIYKNGPYLRIVIASLSSLVESGTMNSSAKRQMLQTVFTSLSVQVKKTTHHDVLKVMQLIEVILLIGEGSSLAKITSLQNLGKIIEKKFTKELGLPYIWNFSEKFSQTFGASRYPTAIFVYLGSVLRLNLFERRAVIPTLRTLVQSILNGNYLETRYDEANSMHLRTIFGNRPELKAQWRTGESISIQSLMSSQESKESKEAEEKPSVSTFVRTQLFNSILSDGHITKDVFPNLVVCLEHPEQQMKIDQTLREKVRESKSKTSSHDFAELHLVQLLKPIHNLESQKENLRKALIYLEKLNLNAPQFINDIKDILTRISAENIETNTEWTVVDTDDWVDLLLCGTEILGSCQNIQGQPEFNKALINDGKTRLVAVKNKQGNLLARCFLKIFEDEETRLPALCKERIYLAAGVDQNIMDEILNVMALRKAKKMNLPLFRATINDGLETGRSLRSYKGAVAFEYEDLDKIGITNGAYIIPSSSLQRMN